MTKPKGMIDSFKGLWNRGAQDYVPSDHFTDCLNTMSTSYGVGSRDSTSSYYAAISVVRQHLYKPNPPFAGTNVPRIIYLDTAGNLYDYNFPGVPLVGNILFKDFSLVNFFGRCYISFSDGKVGISGQNIYVYDGTGVGGFRAAGGVAPTNPVTAHLDTLGNGVLGVGTYLISYAFETASGFITRPAPFVAIDCFGASQIVIDNLPLGPAGTAARWIIGTVAIPLRANLTLPFDVSNASVGRYPQFFVTRIGNNTTATYNVSYYDENLVDSSDYLRTLLQNIPCGVGLMDFNGRLVTYGEYSDPSLIRASTPGEPESFSETSGFVITDPSDNTGVRSATEFRGTLYAYKRQRGYMMADNGLEPSTWQVINFEKSTGTEQYGIASITDAKGSSSDGYIVASLGALKYFNGVFVEPELSYKIRDLWLRINQNYFHKVQVAQDPINLRIYILVPLDSSTSVSHIIYGDYRDGLNPFSIKWHLWQFAVAPTSILIYTDFTGDSPSLVTRISNLSRIDTLNINTPGSDNGAAIDTNFTITPRRDYDGVSHFHRVRVRGFGPAHIDITAYSEDELETVNLAQLFIPSSNPNREYAQLMNLKSEQCTIKFRCNILDETFGINMIKVESEPFMDERAR